MAAHLILYTPVADGIRTASGAGGISSFALSREFLSALTDDERDVLAGLSHVTDDPSAAIAARKAELARGYTTPPGLRTTGTDADAVRAGIAGVVAATRDAERARAQRVADMAKQAHTWLRGPRDRYHGLDLATDFKSDPVLAAEMAAAEKESERFGRVAACRAWADSLDAAVRGLPEVAAAVAAHDPGEQYREGAWAGGLAAVAAVKGAAKAAAEQAAEDERRAWVAGHGSAHLRDLVELGLGYEPVYRDERLALDRPGWQWEPSEWDGRTPIAPPPEAVALLREARKVEPECELLFLVGSDTDGERQFFVRATFLGWMVAMGPVPPR